MKTFYIPSPTANTNKTSFHCHEVETTVQTLTEIFGEAHFLGGDKTTHEWTFTDGENSYAIYDWKEISVPEAHKIIKWHIGAANKELSAKFAEWVQKIIRENRF